MLRLFVIVVGCGLSGMALAQTGSGVKSGLNGTGGMTGANVNTVNGMSANGTPLQQLPGSSMTNGAGNSAMTPSAAGPPGATTGSIGSADGVTTGTVNALPKPSGPSP